MLKASLLRRLIHLVLLAVLGLPAFAPLLALGPSADARLPICCRRGGEHHCAMADSTPSGSAQAHAPWLRCSRYPATVAPARTSSPGEPPRRSASLPAPETLAARLAQTESKRRIARERARGKRGPPAATLT